MYLTFRARNKESAKHGVHLNNAKTNVPTLQKTQRLNYRGHLLALFKATVAIYSEKHGKKCILLAKFIVFWC
jgi:hypothetical protein